MFIFYLTEVDTHRYRVFTSNSFCVDDTGIEPVTPTMSMWCSTAEPIVLGA